MLGSDLSMCQCLFILSFNPFELGLKIDTRAKGVAPFSFGLEFNRS